MLPAVDIDAVVRLATFRKSVYVVYTNTAVTVSPAWFVCEMVVVSTPSCSESYDADCSNVLAACVPCDSVGGEGGMTSTVL